MAKGLIDALLDKIVASVLDDEWKGKYGEKLTARELNLVKLLGRKGKVLRNVYLPKDNGETSELDVIFITQKGIFIFESKNYSGWIFGDEKSKNWTMMLPNKQKNRFYNPILQNKTHLKWMKEYVGAEVPLFSIVVFSERCELKKINVESKDVHVIKRDRTYATVRDIWDANPDVISEDQIEDLYSRLKALTHVDKATKAVHIENIEKKFKKSDVIKESSNTDYKIEYDIEEISDTDDFDYEIDDDADYEYQVDEIKPIFNVKKCPKCGSELVLRTAKKGANIGKEFYGCSGFPKCRYIENLEAK